MQFELLGRLFARRAVPRSRRVALALFVVPFLLSAAPEAELQGPIEVELFENLAAGTELDVAGAQAVERYFEPAFGFVQTPTKFSKSALHLDRSTPFVLRARFERALPDGTYVFRLRSKSTAEFRIDGRAYAQTGPQKPNRESNDALPPEPVPEGDIRPLHYPHQEIKFEFASDGAPHTFELVAVVGGKGLAPFTGDLSISYGKAGEIPRLLGKDNAPLLTDGEWEPYAAAARQRHTRADIARRRYLNTVANAAWDDRHRQVAEWVRRQPAPEIPEVTSRYPVRNDIDRLTGARLAKADIDPRPLASDLEFLRRATLDLTGLIPTAEEVRAFLAVPEHERRQRTVERLLESPGWADHWVAYWQDVLAENPGILKPDLNNTGPFRFWMHQSFDDNVPFDRFVTELVAMEGSKLLGAPAGFGQATLNDAPMAAKADILAQAFLGNKLSCARCHDAPFHPFKQQDLFNMAAMLNGAALKLPSTSTVPMNAGGHKPKVVVALKPGDQLDPHWPFEGLVNQTAFDVPRGEGGVESRYGLATLLVAPENRRFAEVVVNRVWKRYMGRGIVEPVDDWANAKPANPELLDYLVREFLASSYDLKHLARLILNSHTYQREALPAYGEAARLFAGPMRRRMTAEQLVDSLHLAAGLSLDCEELNLNPIGDRALSQFLNMGTPERAWQMTALSNERDRPSLALPRAQTLVDALTSYGWRQSRQDPVTVRDDAPSPIQTLMLANGAMGTRVVRLSDDSAFTRLALEDRPLDTLLEETYLRVLSRQPEADEAAAFRELLEPVWADRRVEGISELGSSMEKTDKRVSWANHFSAEANAIRMEEERRVRMGAEPTRRLKPEFRERYEDVLWALVNSPEFIVIP